jgi:cystathionine gamma-synthase
MVTEPSSRPGPTNAATGDLRPETIAVKAGRPTGGGQPLNVPIVAASTFVSGRALAAGRSPGPGADREYARGDGTDTWVALEEAIGALEGGRALAFSSGMAAISAILDAVPPQSRIVAPHDLYQGTARVLAAGARRLGWQVKLLPTSATDEWLAHVPGADLLWLESPSNPLLDIADVPVICRAASEAGVVTVVDNTFATPLLQQPLSHGATFAVHSATKLIGGHSDLMAGLLVTNDDDAFEAVSERRLLGGAVPGALEAFLALRGLRTLAVRLQRSQENAQELAERLRGHRTVTRVRYPGLSDHPGYELARSTLAGPGSMLSFEMTGSATGTDVRLSRLSLITPATSLGGVETTVERRAKLVGQEHLPETLCRLSVGCEHVEDLWDDLSRALDGAAGSAGHASAS